MSPPQPLDPQLLLGCARRPRAVGWRKWREAAYPPISDSKLAGSLLGCVASGQPGNVRHL